MKPPTARLGALAAMIRDAELARLRQLQEKRRVIEAAVSRLNASRLEMTEAAAPDAAHRAGTDARWLIWAAGQSRSLLIQSAKAAADAETQMVRARRALGRASVLEKLANKETK